MTPYALTAAEATLWTVALVVGVVVLLLVVALMVFLLLQLRDIQLGLLALAQMVDWLRGDAAAAGLSQAASSLRELQEEMRRQDEALSRP